MPIIVAAVIVVFVAYWTGLSTWTVLIGGGIALFVGGLLLLAFLGDFIDRSRQTSRVSPEESGAERASSSIAATPQREPRRASIDGRTHGISRAISIRQPYVELILRGEKTEEYRSRLTNIRERVYIYASATPAEDSGAWRSVGLPAGRLTTGLIVGSVEIADCYWNSEKGKYAYVLRQPERLESPLKPRNQPQPAFWRPVF